MKIKYGTLLIALATVLWAQIIQTEAQTKSKSGSGSGSGSNANSNSNSNSNSSSSSSSNSGSSSSSSYSSNSGSKSKSQPAKVPSPSLDSKCQQIIEKLANTYKGATSLSTKIIVDMNLLAKDGSKQKLPAEYAISISKPNRFSVELISTRGGKVVSNGKRSEFFFKPANAYMIAPSMKTMEEDFGKHEFRFVTAGLLNFAFVRELMETNPYAAIMSDVKNLTYVGSEKIDNLDCDRVRITQGEFVRDIWVTKSTAPMLLKVSPDMTAGMNERARKAGNKILLSFQFKDQILNTTMNDGRFEVAHPTGAKFVREFFHEEGGEFIGKPAPDAVLSMSDGTKIKLSSLKDRFVVLDFWATWCPPCVMSLPVFAKASEQFKSKGVVFIAVNKGEDTATAKRWFQQKHLSVPLASDVNLQTSSAFHVEGIPCTVFIGRDGNVKGYHVGISPNNLRENFIEDLNKLIAGKSLRRER